MKATLILNDSMIGSSAPMNIEVDSVEQALRVSGNVVKNDPFYTSGRVDVDYPAGMTTQFELDSDGSVKTYTDRSGKVVDKRNV